MEMEFNVGDSVLIEEAWEDETGAYHDEWLEVTKVNEDGTFEAKFDDERLNDYYGIMTYEADQPQDVIKASNGMKAAK